MLYPWTYIPNFLSDADVLFMTLSQQLTRTQYPITMFGKTMMQPRLVSFYAEEGVAYSYSRTYLYGNGRDPTLNHIKIMINDQYWLIYNSVLCNLYRDGNDSMWWHSDDEAELWDDPCIASVTLWASRVFKMRHKHTREVHNILLEHGSLLLMHSRSQLDREHCMPKTSKLLWSRINLTFRQII
jgi:alkylated DNA repair dioxygenase AlkB